MEENIELASISYCIGWDSLRELYPPWIAFYYYNVRTALISTFHTHIHEHSTHTGINVFYVYIVVLDLV